MNIPELQKMLILSMGHLPPGQPGRYGYDLDGFGTLLYVPNSPSWREEISDCLGGYLEAPMQLAASLGATWIKFDPDGPVMDNLPVYEWE